MRDLLTEIVNAKKIKNSNSNWNEEKLLIMVNCFQKDDKSNNILWDYLSGEEICTFFISKKVVAYVHSLLPICFCSKEFGKYITPWSNALWFVTTEDFAKEEWFVDVKKLQEVSPEVHWLACDEAVNPESFSIDEFFFAAH